MKAFYFANDSKTLRYGDNRTIVVGETHEVTGEIIPCKNGLHASTRVVGALTYAPGSNLYLVELSGTVAEESDKVAASKRKYLAHYDATDLLRAFARKQALINIEKIKPYCSEEDYKLIVNYLNTGDEELKPAAHSAANSAARSAYSVANSAARSAAWSAGRLAAWEAANSAARSAAWSAGRLAAWEAANSAAYSAAYLAAYSAAYLAASYAANSADSANSANSAVNSAAWSAANSAANKMLTEMIAEATGWEI